MRNNFEIFWRFLLLGRTSFGGPMAHIGYFKKEFIDRLNWLSSEEYAKFVALSQFLPGPSSSQTGFCIGLKKGGLFGGFFAFLGFTLPSFLLLYFLAVLHISSVENQFIFGLIDGLRLFAVVIVADATISMFKSFCKDRLTIFIFILCSLILFMLQGASSQILVIFLAGVIGAKFAKFKGVDEVITTTKPNLYILLLFTSILVFAFFYTSRSEILNIFNAFYKMGSLVFGGGHVILPLIAQNELIDKDSFLLGYAFAQAVPGPMFTIATYLGAVNISSSPLLGALSATAGIFLPGFLLILVFAKSFESYSKKPLVAKALISINASVVAIIFTAFCNPIFVSGVGSIVDLAVAVFGLFILRKYKISIFLLIALFATYGVWWLFCKKSIDKMFLFIL